MLSCWKSGRKPTLENLRNWFFFMNWTSSCGTCHIVEALNRSGTGSGDFRFDTFVSSSNALLERFEWFWVLHLRQLVCEAAKHWWSFLSRRLYNRFGLVVAAEGEIIVLVRIQFEFSISRKFKKKTFTKLYSHHVSCYFYFKNHEFI